MSFARPPRPVATPGTAVRSDDQTMPGVGGGSDVFRASRGTGAAVWGTPEAIPGLDTVDYEGEAFVDTSGAIWFTGNGDIFGGLRPLACLSQRRWHATETDPGRRAREHTDRR